MNELFRALSEYPLWYKLPLAVGAATFLFTGFLYENEDGKIQNRLEEWWCKLDDAANSALDKNLRIIQGFARMAQANLERLFGKSLFSSQSIGVSICWGMISAKLTVVLFALTSGAPPLDIILGELVTMLFFLYLSWAPRVLPSTRHRRWLCIILFSWLLFIFAAYYSGTLGNKIHGPPPIPKADNERIVRLGLAVIPLYTFGVLFSVIICIFFIAVSRRSLRYIVRAKSNGAAVRATLLHVVFLSILVSLHLLAVDTLRSQSDFRQYVFQMITPIMGHAYWMAIFFVLLVAHIAFWGIMRRPVYALQRIGGEGRKKLFVAIGGILLVFAFPELAHVLKPGVELIESIF